MAESTTKLTIQAQTKGIAEATKEASKLSDSVGGISKKAGGASSGIKKVMKELRAQLKQSTQEADALTRAYIAQSNQLKHLQKQYEGVATAVKKTRKERGDDAKEAKAAQSAPPPPPTTISGRIRNFFGGGVGGGGVGGTRGPQGPGGGGFQQGFLQGVLPEAFIQRGPGALAQAGGAIAGRTLRGIAGAGASLLASPLSGSQAAVDALGKIPFAGALAGGLNMSLSAAQAEIGAQRAQGSLMPYLRSPTSGMAAFGASKAIRDSLGETGLAYGGLSQNETIGHLAQMAASGGGFASGYSPKVKSQAFAAAQGFGIDMGTAGVLARGDQLGASTGTQQYSTLAKTIADGISMHLEGSELTRYVQNIAGDIEQFGTTGIKVDESSRGTIGRMLQSTGGYSGVRAASLAAGITGTMNQVADSGPQNTGQFALLRAFGYDPSDPESYYRAQEKMDNASPNEQAKAFASARNTALSGFKGLSKYARAGATREILGEMGQHLRIGEARKESTRLLSAKDVLSAESGSDYGGADNVIDAAGRSSTFTSSRIGAQMADLSASTGRAYIPSMMNMDAQAKKTLNAMSNVGSKFMKIAEDMARFGSYVTSQAAQAVGFSSSSPETPQ